MEFIVSRGTVPVSKHLWDKCVVSCISESQHIWCGPTQLWSKLHSSLVHEHWPLFYGVSTISVWWVCESFSSCCAAHYTLITAASDRTNVLGAGWRCVTAGSVIVSIELCSLIARKLSRQLGVSGKISIIINCLQALLLRSSTWLECPVLFNENYFYRVLKFCSYPLSTKCSSSWLQ